MNKKVVVVLVVILLAVGGYIVYTKMKKSPYPPNISKIMSSLSSSQQSAFKTALDQLTASEMAYAENIAQMIIGGTPLPGDLSAWWNQTFPGIS